MCDYCDCRSRPLLAELSLDHSSIASMIRTARDAMRDREPEALAERARVLHQELTRHAYVEEQILYPELQQAEIPQEPLVEDHARIESTIDATAVGNATDEEVSAALSELEEHIHREEYDLFPAIHQLLDDRAWDRMTARCDQTGDGGPLSRPTLGGRGKI